MQELRFEHGFYYPDNHDVPLSDIAATLIAHEKLLPIIADAFENLVPGLSIDDRKIILEHIQRSSLKEHFFVALFLVFQKDLEKEVPALFETVTGVHVSDRYDTIVTVLFLVALYYGASAIFRKGKRAEQAAAPASIQADQDQYIGIAAEQLGTTPEKVRAAFDKAIGRQKLATVQRAAVDLFRPAKRGGNGRIVPRGLPEISKATVADFPTEVALAEMDDDAVPLHLPRARLDIRATDRDKGDKGWAGKVETDDMKTKRLPIRLAPGVDRNMLAGLYMPEVEAVLESRIKEDGGTTPIRIHVYRVL